MATMDIFNADAFRVVELTAAIDKVPRQPNLITSMNIFTPRPVRTEKVEVEERDGTLSLIQTSKRGAPLEERKTEKRNVRDFRTSRIAKGDTVQASEIADWRAFGTDSELVVVADEVMRRLAGETGLMREAELTHENMGLGAVQGIVLDADGSVIYNWYDAFGVTQPAEIDFDLDNASPAAGALLKKCDQVVTAMRNAAKGAWGQRTRVIGLCGTNFWRDLITHPEILKLWELATLYGDQTGLRALLGAAIGTPIEYGDITFMRYWGTEDDSTVAVPTDKVKFFPMDAPGAFQVAYSPLETMGFVNTPGKDMYAMIVRDLQRDMWIRPEIYSYPLFMCTRPLMLQRGKRT